MKNNKSNNNSHDLIVTTPKVGRKFITFIWNSNLKFLAHFLDYLGQRWKSRVQLHDNSIGWMDGWMDTIRVAVTFATPELHICE
jgi:hypothetical protein